MLEKSLKCVRGYEAGTACEKNTHFELNFTEDLCNFLCETKSTQF